MNTMKFSTRQFLWYGVTIFPQCSVLIFYINSQSKIVFCLIFLSLIGSLLQEYCHQNIQIRKYFFEFIKKYNFLTNPNDNVFFKWNKSWFHLWSLDKSRYIGVLRSSRDSISSWYTLFGRTCGLLVCFILFAFPAIFCCNKLLQMIFTHKRINITMTTFNWFEIW